MAAEGSALPLPPELLALSVPEYFTLAAACERVLPRDESPGALDLQVPRYIDHSLWADRDARGWRKEFRGGLGRLDAHARTNEGRPFYQLPVSRQDEILAEWEHAKSTERGRFFARLVTATLEGAMCDPVYGGNDAARGWALIGARRDPFGPKSPPPGWTPW